jgi:hypothetical protein
MIFCSRGRIGASKFGTDGGGINSTFSLVLGAFVVSGGLLIVGVAALCTVVALEIVAFALLGFISTPVCISCTPSPSDIGSAFNPNARSARSHSRNLFLLV